MNSKEKLSIFLGLLIVTTGFSANNSEGMEEVSTARICSGLQDMTSQVEAGNMTEFPDEALTEMNQGLEENEELAEALSSLDGTRISLELLNNETVCFNGTILFNNSRIDRISIEQDPGAGSGKEHILVHVDMIHIERIINDIQSIQQGEELGLVHVVSTFFRTVTRIIGYIMSDDFMVKPFGAITKIFEIIPVIMQSMSSGMSQAPV